MNPQVNTNGNLNGEVYQNLEDPSSTSYNSRMNDYYRFSKDTTILPSGHTLLVSSRSNSPTGKRYANSSLNNNTNNNTTNPNYNYSQPQSTSPFNPHRPPLNNADLKQYLRHMLATPDFDWKENGHDIIQLLSKKILSDLSSEALNQNQANLSPSKRKDGDLLRNVYVTKENEKLKQTLEQLKTYFAVLTSVSSNYTKEMFEQYELLLKLDLEQNNMKIMNYINESVSVQSNAIEDHFARLETKLAAMQEAVLGKQLDTHNLVHTVQAKVHTQSTVLIEQARDVEKLKNLLNRVAASVSDIDKEIESLKNVNLNANPETRPHTISMTSQPQYQYQSQQNPINTNGYPMPSNLYDNNESPNFINHYDNPNTNNKYRNNNSNSNMPMVSPRQYIPVNSNVNPNNNNNKPGNQNQNQNQNQNSSVLNSNNLNSRQKSPDYYNNKQHNVINPTKDLQSVNSTNYNSAPYPYPSNTNTNVINQPELIQNISDNVQESLESTTNNLSAQISSLKTSVTANIKHEVNLSLDSFKMEMIQVLMKCFPSPNMAIYKFDPIPSKIPLVQLFNRDPLMNESIKYSNYFAVTYRNRIIFGYGKHDRQLTDAIYTVFNNAVSELQVKNKPSRRMGMAYTVSHNRLYLYGGYLDSKTYYGKIYSMNLDQLDKFTVVDDHDCFDSRANSRILSNIDITTNHYEGRPAIYLTGGMSRTYEASSEILGFDIESKKLIHSNCFIPARQSHIMAPLTEHRFLIGWGYSSKTSLSDTYIYDYKNKTVSEVKFKIDLNNSMALDWMFKSDLNKEIIILGGKDSGNCLTIDSTNVDKYDLKKDDKYINSFGKFVVLDGKLISIKNSVSNLCKEIDID